MSLTARETDVRFMAIVRTPPPNFDAIVARLPQARRPGVVFTYGRTIHSPSNGHLSADLVYHESIHTAQQGDDPAGWWDLYLDDVEFRLSQEIAAYHGQYNLIATHYDRKTQRRMLDRMATALSSSLYGGLLSKSAAREAIVNGH